MSLEQNNRSEQLPDQIRTSEDHDRVLGCAEEIRTQCGDGHIVWHQWGNGTPVMLLHGGSGSWTHWIRNIKPLVDNGYQVIVPDLPGFGDSALPPDGRDGDVMPKWLDRGLAEIIGDQACITIGFSFGAMVGTLWAASVPSRIAALVLVGAPALSDIPMPRLGLRAWEHLPDTDAQNRAHRYNLRALMFARDESIDEFAVQLHAANLKRDRLKRRRLARTDIVVRTLPSVSCPVAGIWGSDDAVYRDRLHTVEPALKTAPGFQSLMLLDGSGHWTQFEDAGLFNSTLLQTINQIADGE